MDQKFLDLINNVSVFVFVLLAILVVFKISLRYLRYKRENLPIPELLPRDLFLIAGLVLPFAGVLLFRALGIQAREAWWYPVWVIGSDILGVSGMANWAYYEFFRIEKKTK